MANPGDIDLSSISFANFRASFAKEGRFLSLRDLLKLCNRLVGTKLTLGPDQHRHLIITLLSDLYECFLCFISNTSVREDLAIGIGCKLNINRDEVKSLVINNKPSFDKSQKVIKCGRVTLKLKSNDLLDQSFIK